MNMSEPVTPEVPRKPSAAELSAERGATFLDSLIEKKRVPATGRKRLPAYGRQLADLRRKGMAPRDGICIVLDDWTLCEHRARVVIPNDVDADSCRYDFVSGIDCFIVWDQEITPPSRTRKAIKEILRCNSHRLLALGFIGESSQIEWIKTKDGIIEGCAK